MLNREQKKVLADFFEKFALAIATATAVRLLFDVSDTPEWIYALAAVVIMLMVLVAMILLKDADTEDVMRTEVRKGVFHIGSAEVRSAEDGEAHSDDVKPQRRKKRKSVR